MCISCPSKLDTCAVVRALYSVIIERRLNSWGRMTERWTGMREGRRLVCRIPGFELGIFRMTVKSAMPTVGKGWIWCVIKLAFFGA
jgi:hypothetical protein